MYTSFRAGVKPDREKPALPARCLTLRASPSSGFALHRETADKGHPRHGNSQWKALNHQSSSQRRQRPGRVTTGIPLEAELALSLYTPGFEAGRRHLAPDVCAGGGVPKYTGANTGAERQQCGSASSAPHGRVVRPFGRGTNKEPETTARRQKTCSSIWTLQNSRGQRNEAEHHSRQGKALPCSESTGTGYL